MIEPIVILGLITCRNPDGLVKSLEAVNSLKGRKPDRIIIVDNDNKMAGVEAAEDYLKSLSGCPPYAIFHEQQAGIPFARNRVIREALKHPFSYLAMFDDDEYPCEGWLDAIVSTAVEDGADVVGGPVRGVCDGQIPAPFLQSDFNKSGGRIHRSRWIVESTANLLFSRGILEVFKDSWFSENFAMTGGSDAEFLKRIFDSGYKHAFADGALVYEDVPLARVTKTWYVKRCYRNGNVYTRIRLLHFGRPMTLLIECANIAGLVAKSAVEVLKNNFSERARFEVRLNLSRIKGKWDSLFGKNYDEYDRGRYRT